jgi:N-methylhydantoinase A
VPLRHGRLEMPEHLEDLREDFHRAHEELFAVRDATAPVELVTWRAHARCTLRRRQLQRARPEPSHRAPSGLRPAYFPGLGLSEVPVRGLEALVVGERLHGPLIVESPVTTVVLDEWAAVELSPHGSLLIDPYASESGDGERARNG